MNRRSPSDRPATWEAGWPDIPALRRADSLAQQAYDTLRRLIRQGRIARGEMLSEAGLAAALGVSRTPVREALLQLFQDGIVEILPKRGFRLAELDRAAIEEIRLMRCALEEIVVRRVAAGAPRDGLAALRRLAQDAIEGAAAIFEHDEAFHAALADLAGLGQVKRVLSGLRAKTYLIASGAEVPAARSMGALREHLSIVERLEARDPEGAAALMAEHIGRSITAFEQAAAGAAAVSPRRGHEETSSTVRLA